MNFTNFFPYILATIISVLVFNTLSYSIYMRILFAPLQKPINKVKSKFVYQSGIFVLGSIIIYIFKDILNYSDRTYGIIMGIFIGIYVSFFISKKKLDKTIEK